MVGRSFSMIASTKGGPIVSMPGPPCRTQRSRRLGALVIVLASLRRPGSADGQTEVACQHETLDLTRALADLEDLGVSIEPGDR